MTPLLLIPARMASARLPGKPLADIAGRPMVLHVLDRAREAALGPVAVAACDEAVIDAVRADGGIAVMTDPALPSGSDRVHAAARLLDPLARHDVIINLQGDLPDLSAADLAAVLTPLADPDCDIATLVAPITSAAEADEPSVVKAACAFAAASPVARVLYFSRAAIPWTAIPSAAILGGDGPRWHHVGVYAYRREALNRFVALPESPLERQERLEQLRALEAGQRIFCARIQAAPCGVDTPADLERVRLRMAAR